MTLHKAPRAGRKQAGAAWLILAIGVVIAAGAALAIGRLNGHADSRRRTQVVLAEIERFAHTLRLAEVQASLHGTLTAGQRARFDEAQSQIRPALASLSLVVGSPPTNSGPATAYFDDAYFRPSAGCAPEATNPEQGPFQGGGDLQFDDLRRGPGTGRFADG